MTLGCGETCFTLDVAVGREMERKRRIKIESQKMKMLPQYLNNVAYILSL